MLGPDAVTEQVDGDNVPVMRLFAQSLGEQLLRDEVELPEQYTFAQMAQLFQNHFGENTLLAAAEGFFKRRAAPQNQVLADLAAMPFELVVNTTPGGHMEEAFRESGMKQPESDWYYAGGDEKKLVHEGTPQEPLVFHLYGCVEELYSLVLSENDLLDFLVKVISGEPQLPDNISSAFTDRKNCFLFLGFGLRRWYLRILLHVLYKSRRGGNRSFALEKFDASLNDATVERTKLFFEEGHKIYFFDTELEEFAAELSRRVEARQNKRTRDRAPELPADAPVAFLCHASEDKEYARKLYEQLEKKGIRPWLDENDIRGGTEWDEVIKQTIKRGEIDYFVVLQSKTLAAKRVSYVNKEITIALERQDYYRGTEFIIPTLIDDPEKLAELSHLQSIDLTQENGLGKLVTTIKRSHQIRSKSL